MRQTEGASIFKITWDSLKQLYGMTNSKKQVCLVFTRLQSTLLEGILRDSAYEFLDDINTPEKETLKQDINSRLKRHLDLQEPGPGREDYWGKLKATRIDHLARLAPFSRLDMDNGGGEFAINAVKKDHGPSWRMIVQLTKNTEAYGIYPGGSKRQPRESVL